jgi:hypothetical protein
LLRPPSLTADDITVGAFSFAETAVSKNKQIFTKQIDKILDLTGRSLTFTDNP